MVTTYHQFRKVANSDEASLPYYLFVSVDITPSENTITMNRFECLFLSFLHGW